jgi:hypothetical protein
MTRTIGVVLQDDLIKRVKVVGEQRKDPSLSHTLRVLIEAGCESEEEIQAQVQKLRQEVR